MAAWACVALSALESRSRRRRGIVLRISQFRGLKQRRVAMMSPQSEESSPAFRAAGCIDASFRLPSCGRRSPSLVSADDRKQALTGGARYG
jgi:hypothetical protein